MGLSPMMQHYLKLKEQYKDCIVFYRLGDFYEMFFDDAVLASRELEITLTGRDCGLDEKAPMCGIPFHAADSYIAKLLNRKYKVAICEQLSEPSAGKIVERDVVRVITPGTVIENDILKERENNYICAFIFHKTTLALAYADISTGEFFAKEIKEVKDIIATLSDELVKIMPSEIITNQAGFELGKSMIQNNNLPPFTAYYEYSFDAENGEKNIINTLGVSSLKPFDIQDKAEVIAVCSALLDYIRETQKRNLNNIHSISLTKNQEQLFIDSNTRRNLELVASMRDGKKRGTLISVIDNTSTMMGARLLRRNIEQPYQSEQIINDRIDAVEELMNKYVLRDTFTKSLSVITDIERLTSKIAYRSIGPRDVVALAQSLDVITSTKSLLETCDSIKMKELNQNIAIFDDLTEIIKSAIIDTPPLLARDGNIIKKGYNSKLDEYQNARNEGAKWLLALEQQESEATGIKNLKIKYNRVFGYFIEVNKQYNEWIPLRYVRKQTVSNNERYITDELKEIENKILGAEESALNLEQQLYDNIITILNDNIVQIQSAGRAIAELDVIVNFANLSKKMRYAKPTINNKVSTLFIKDGRHPVVEHLQKNEQFVPNDTILDTTDNKIMIITGPNMAGKSTYMRQVALITLMAHLGCFVPASEAQIPICDRIFTRVGASDELAFGYSTFMLEMSEVSTILNNATDRSLVILDEVGRGTATYDGLSIAWAIVEYLSQHKGARTLFATHYHELTELEGMLSGVKNFHISVKEYNDNIIFLRKIIRGGTNKSFGIEVAKLAGVNNEVIERAKQILVMLERSGEINISSIENLSDSNRNEMVKIDTTAKQIKEELQQLDINQITPVMAVQILERLIDKSNEIK